MFLFCYLFVSYFVDDFFPFLFLFFFFFCELIAIFSVVFGVLFLFCVYTYYRFFICGYHQVFIYIQVFIVFILLFSVADMLFSSALKSLHLCFPLLITATKIPKWTLRWKRQTYRKVGNYPHKKLVGRLKKNKVLKSSISRISRDKTIESSLFGINF